MESMDDYKEELEASFRRIREGDILTGTVIDVNEEGVTLDLKYYAPGFISAEEMIRISHWRRLCMWGIRSRRP